MRLGMQLSSFLFFLVRNSPSLISEKLEVVYPIPKKLVTFVVRGSLIFLTCVAPGCRPEVTRSEVSSSPHQATESLLIKEEAYWTGWISSREGNHRENLSTLLPSPLGARDEEGSNGQNPYLFYEPGYSFPSLRARVLGEMVTISLQPHLKRVHALGITRLALSPGENKVALLFSKKFDPHDALLILDLRKNSREVLLEGVYDFVWGDTDTLLFYTLQPNGIPSELYALKQGESEKIITADSPGESILIQGTIHKALRIHKTSTPVATKVGTLPFDQLRTDTAAITWYDGAALARNEGGTYVLSYRTNPFGDLHLYSSHTLTQKVIFSGTHQNVLLDLVEVPAGVILYSGNGHTRGLSIIESTGKILSYSPPPPLLQLSATYSRDRITIYGESVVCPSEKLAELPIHDDDSGNVFTLKTPSCKNVTATFQSTLSRDGTHTPLTITKIAGLERGIVLYAYGAYGVSLPLRYSERLRFLAEEGYAVALCHARGGTEFGPLWHEHSRMSGKLLTVEDAESCLLKIRTSLPRSLPVIGFGHSAGGWLLSQIARIRPRYLSALLLDAPMISFPNKSESQDVSSRGITAREELEWVTNKTRPDLGMIPYPKGTNIFTIIREADNLISPTSLATWMNTIRTQASNSNQIISYVAKNAAHTLKLTPNDERIIYSSWREFLRGIQEPVETPSLK